MPASDSSSRMACDKPRRESDKPWRSSSRTTRVAVTHGHDGVAAKASADEDFVRAAETGHGSGVREREHQAQLGRRNPDFVGRNAARVVDGLTFSTRPMPQRAPSMLRTSARGLR